jgi:hypothetical protein
MSVALVLVTFAPKTFPSFIKEVNIIALPVAQISLRNSSPRDLCCHKPRTPSIYN